MTAAQRAALAHLLAAHLPPHYIAPAVQKVADELAGNRPLDIAAAVREVASILPQPYSAMVGVLSLAVARVLAMPDVDAPSIVVTDERDR